MAFGHALFRRQQRVVVALSTYPAELTAWGSHMLAPSKFLAPRTDASRYLTLLRVPCSQVSAAPCSAATNSTQSNCLIRRQSPRAVQGRAERLHITSSCLRFVKERKQQCREVHAQPGETATAYIEREHNLILPLLHFMHWTCICSANRGKP